MIKLFYSNLYRIKKLLFLDLFLNVISPLFVGYLIYLDFFMTPPVVKNYLADGLWAYALISALLIIWDRKPYSLWIGLAILLGVGFEFLQHTSIIPGIGDFFDLLTYLIFSSFALYVNKKLCLFNIKSQLT
jgi:hypothetical protein